MDAYSPNQKDPQQMIAEVIEGLREFQMVLVDSAGKVSDPQVAQKLYRIAGEHGDVEASIRHMAGSHVDQPMPSTSPFLNQIRSLGARLRKFGDFSRSQVILCEIIQTEDRMIRRFRALIDQITDLKWRRRLSKQLDHLLEVRENLGRFREGCPGQQGHATSHTSSRYGSA